MSGTSTLPVPAGQEAAQSPVASAARPESLRTPPISLLREQALVWEKETGNLLRGLISTETGANASMIHSLFIEAPRLDGYRYRIVSVMHNVFPLYPAYVVYDAATGYEYEPSRPSKNSFTGILDHQADDAERLKAILRRIFDSEEVQNIVASLAAQSEMPVAA